MYSSTSGAENSAASAMGIETDVDAKEKKKILPKHHMQYTVVKKYTKMETIISNLKG